MKTLHIVRHAEAVSKDLGLPDFERKLTKKGTKDSRAVARRLRKAGFEADHMISSPAARALETARSFAKALSYPVKKIDLQQPMYDDANNDSLMKIIQNAPADASSVFMFGHDPSFSDFAHHIVGDLDQNMPKGAVVTIEFETDSWSEAGPGKGRLALFDYPMTKTEKAKRLKPIRREIAASLAAMVEEQLRVLEPRAAEKLRPYTKKKMRKITSRFLKWAPHPFLTRLGTDNPGPREPSSKSES